MMPDNTVQFRLSVTGAPESAAAIERVRTALGDTTLTLDRYVASQLTAQKATAQPPAAWAKGISDAAGLEKAGVQPADVGRVEVLTRAYNAARSAVQGATAPTGLWAKGISDAAAAAGAGVQPHNNLAMAFGRTGSASRQFGDDLKVAHRELFEGARLTRSFVDALLLATPGIGGATGMFTRLSRETSGFSLAQIGATAAGLALVAGVGVMISRARELADAQHTANKAIAELDVSQAQSAFAQTAEAVHRYEDALEHARSGTGWAMIAGQVDAFAAAFSQARAKVIIDAEAVAQTFEFFGKGQAILGAGREELTEQAKAFAVLGARAPDVATLTRALGAQAVAIHKAAGESVELAKKEDERYKATRERQIGAVGDPDLRAKLTDQLAEEMAIRARQRTAALKTADDELASTRIANAARVGAVAAQEIQDAGRLIEIKASLAKADADFFGTQLRGASVAALQARQAKELEAQQTKIGSLQGPERQAALRELERMEAEHDLQITAERRTSYARDLALVAAKYAHEEKLGQGSLEAQLGFLKRAAKDENLSLEQRRRFAEEAHGKTLETAQAMLAIAGGERSRLETERQMLQTLKDQERSLREQARQIQDNKDKRDKTRRELDEKDREIIARGGKPENLTPRQQQEREVAEAEKRIRDRARDAQAQDEADAKTMADARAKAEEDKKKQEASKLSLTDIPGLMDKARQRDEAFLRGAPGTPEELAGAVGREDFWRRVGASQLPTDTSVPVGGGGAPGGTTGPPMRQTSPGTWTNEGPWTGHPQAAPSGAGGGAPSPASVSALLTAMPQLGQDMGALSTSFAALVETNQATVAKEHEALARMQEVVNKALTAASLAQQLLDQFLAKYGRR